MNATTRLLSVFAVALVLFPPTLQAKCVGKNGEVIFSSRSCEAEGGTWTGPERAAPSASSETRTSAAPDTNAKDQWTFARHSDDMTGKSACMAISPKIFVGSRGNTFYFITLRVGRSPAGPIVAIKSERGFADSPESFHVEVAGLGVKVGSGEFLPVTARVGSDILGFTGPVAEEIVGQLSAAKTFRARVRFWPYEQTYDSEPVTTDGFGVAHELAEKCSEN